MQNIVAVDLGPVTKVTLVNISGGPLAIKDVQMIPGEFSGRLQIFNYQSLVLFSRHSLKSTPVCWVKCNDLI